LKNTFKLIFYFFLCTKFLHAQYTVNDIQNIVKNTIVIDGTVQPVIDENGIRSYYPGKSKGKPDLSTIKDTVGLDIGAITLPDLKRNRIELINRINGKVIMYNEDLDLHDKYGIIFYAQKRINPNLQLNGNISNIKKWFDSGLRILQLSYSSGENHGKKETLGHGDYSEDNLGLTKMGKKAIKLMNSIGMIIDVSHCNKQTTLDAVKISSQPVIATHVNSSKVYNIRRNKSDEELIAIANSGGVIGLTPIGPFLGVKNYTNDNTDKFIEHILHVKELVGINHIGFASDSDLNGWPEDSEFYPCKELSGFRWYENVALKLMNEHNFNEEDIKKFLGLNFLRVYKSILPYKNKK